MSASGQEVLHTAGKLCEDDITIDYTQPGGGGANLQTKSVTYTPDETGISDTILPDPGYDGLDEVDVTVDAIPDTYVGSAVPQRDSTSLTSTGQVVHVPAGYYASAALRGVNNGTAGTPTASKGAVNNHSVDVTPSVTNTTGWITGGTQTGTPVTVSASELVSGDLPINENGSNIDVTNYETVSVNVSGGSASDGYGDPYTMQMGGAQMLTLGGSPRFIHDTTQSNARRSIWCKTGDHPLYEYISSSNWQTPTNFYPFKIPAGATKVTLTPNKSVQMAVQFYYYTSDYVQISDSGWTNTPIVDYAIPSNAEYAAFPVRVSPSNPAFTAINQPDFVEITFS